MDDPGILVPIIAVSIGLVAVIGRVVLRPWFQLMERRLATDAALTAEKANTPQTAASPRIGRAS